MKATLITDIAGPEITPKEREWLTHPCLGGIILFTRHFESKAQIKQLISEIKEINSGLIITVDHEGGRVQRFRDEFTCVQAMGKLGELYAVEPKQALHAAKSAAIVLAYELLEVGVDLTYAPVLDINYLRNTVIADRAFSHSAKDVIPLAEAFISGLKFMDFAVVAKHFPGHGWVNLDSHVACPVDERTFDEIDTQDMVPFKSLISQIDWMMPAHVVYNKVDSEPAGFSKIWLQDILRDTLSFQGHIVSDDLSMQGAAVKGGYKERSLAALQAGCDILLACNSSEASVEILKVLTDEKITPLPLDSYGSKQDLGKDVQSAYEAAKQNLSDLGLIK